MCRLKIFYMNYVYVLPIPEPSTYVSIHISFFRPPVSITMYGKRSYEIFKQSWCLKKWHQMSKLNSYQKVLTDMTLFLEWFWCFFMKRARTLLCVFTRLWYSAFGFLFGSSTVTWLQLISITSSIQWNLFIYIYTRNVRYTYY